MPWGAPTPQIGSVFAEFVANCSFASRVNNLLLHDALGWRGIDPLLCKWNKFAADESN